jgi:hypothetical protein
LAQLEAKSTEASGDDVDFVRMAGRPWYGTDCDRSWGSYRLGFLLSYLKKDFYV